VQVTAEVAGRPGNWCDPWSLWSSEPSLWRQEAARHLAVCRNQRNCVLANSNNASLGDHQVRKSNASNGICGSPALKWNLRIVIDTTVPESLRRHLSWPCG
jgi:5-methylcytosine-specific restriction endonuclease McrA